MITSIFVLSLIGFGVSLYTYFLEGKIKKQSDYKPVCDISDNISCSKPIKSEYGKLFYVSNSVVGMLFYVVVGILTLFDAHKAIFVASLGSVVVSLFLAYILYFKIKSVCILCTTLYIVNALLLIQSFRLVF